MVIKINTFFKQLTWRKRVPHKGYYIMKGQGQGSDETTGLGAAPCDFLVNK